MNAVEILVAVTTLFVFSYLVWSLLRPEDL